MRRLAAITALAIATSAFAAPPDNSQVATRVAAASRDPNALFALAEALRTGKGVSPDPAAAMMWYRRAAALGQQEASDTLGFLLFAGGQRAEAMPYIEKAAARGDPRAFYLLGTAHFNGDYAARDWPLGYAQMRRAAEGGVIAARKSLIVMDKYLLAADRAKADAILTTLPPVRRITTPAPTFAVVTPADPKPAPAATATATATAAAPAPAPSATPSPSPAPVRGPAPIATTAPPPPPVPAARGAWRVQLGAYGSADRARGDWERLAGRVPALRQFDQRVVQAGAVQRLQAAGIGDRAAAERLCRQVRAKGRPCLVLER